MKAFNRSSAPVRAHLLIVAGVAVVAGATGCGGAIQFSAVVRSKTFTTQQGYGELMDIECQPGEIATGGGYALASGIPSTRIPTAIQSFPVGDPPTGWRVRLYWSPAGEHWEEFVVCAKLQ